MLKNNDFKLYFDLNYSECTGCMACVAVCWRKAIEIKEDSEGFKYPKYSEDKCVGCSMCKKICPSYKINEIKVNDIEDSISLRARLKDDNAIINSTSGGVFYGLAHYFIQKNGYVFGAGFDSTSQSVHHMCIEKIDDLHLLQNSKYVQSDVADVYNKVEGLLKDDKYVLYSGTPCQVAAIKNFLQKDYGNFYTVDILCHGVSSPMLLQKEMLLHRGSAHKYDNIKFRCKGKRTKSFYYLYLESENESPVYLNERQSLYYKMFFDNTSLRESCYNCKYSNTERTGDITLGDCSSSDKSFDFFPLESVSSVFINSNKAKQLWNMTSNMFHLKDLDVVTEISLNHPLQRCVSRPKERDTAIFECLNTDYKTLTERTCEKVTFKTKYRIKRNLYIPSIVILANMYRKRNKIINSLYQIASRFYHGFSETRR